MYVKSVEGVQVEVEADGHDDMSESGFHALMSGSTLYLNTRQKTRRLIII